MTEHNAADGLSLLDYTPQLQTMIESARKYQASPRHFLARFKIMENTNECSVLKCSSYQDVLNRRGSLWSDSSNKDSFDGRVYKGRIWDSSEELLKDVGALLDPDRPYKPSYWPATKPARDETGDEERRQRSRSLSVQEWCNMISHHRSRSPFLSEIGDIRLSDGSICPSPTDGEFWTTATTPCSYEDDDVFLSETATNRDGDQLADNGPAPSSPPPAAKPVPLPQHSLSHLVREMSHWMSPPMEVALTAGDSPTWRKSDTTTQKHKDWITDEILYVINFRDSLYKASKKNPNPSIIELYKKVRNMVVGMTRNAKRTYDKNKGIVEHPGRRSRGVSSSNHCHYTYQTCSTSAKRYGSIPF